jgi:hypothetical protein
MSNNGNKFGLPRLRLPVCLGVSFVAVLISLGTASARCSDSSVAGGARDSSSFGISAQNSDNATAFNALPENAVVKFQSGTYRIDSPIRLKSGQKLIFMPGAKVYAPFPTAGGRAGVVTQASFQRPIQNVLLCGLHLFKDGLPTQYGRFVNLKCDDCTISDFVLDGPQTDRITGGGGIAIAGANFTISNGSILKCTPWVGCFGIRVLGGSGTISNIYVEAGDDGIAIAPAPGSADIHDIVVKGIRGISRHARLVSVSVLTSPGTKMTSNISRVSVSDVSGQAAREALKCANRNNEGKISDISFSDIDIELTDPRQQSPFQVFATVGPVQGVATRNVVIRNAVMPVVAVSGNVSNIDVSGVSFR